MHVSLAKAVIDRNANSAFRSLFFSPTEESLTPRLSPSPPPRATLLFRFWLLSFSLSHDISVPFLGRIGPSGVTAVVSQLLFFFLTQKKHVLVFFF